MSSETATRNMPENTSDCHPKRVRFNKPSPSVDHEENTNSRAKRSTSPSDAAFSISSRCLMLLFPSLQKNIQPYLKEFLSNYGGVFWKIQKQELDIQTDPSMTTSPSKIKFPLKFRAGVEDSPSARGPLSSQKKRSFLLFFKKFYLISPTKHLI